MSADGVTLRLRVGRKVGRTLYQQTGMVPSDSDQLVGMVDTPELAQQIVEAWNKQVRARECLIPDCRKPADGPAYCSVAHSDEATDFRRWLAKEGLE